MLAGLPRSSTSPEVIRLAPQSSSIVSVRPEPTSPAKPRISPRRSVKEMFSTLLPVRPRASSSTSPGALLRAGKLSLSSRPTIRRTSSLRLVPFVLSVVT